MHKRTFSESIGGKLKDHLPVHFGKKGGAETHHNLRKQKEEIKEKAIASKEETVLEGKYGKGLKMLKMMGGFQVGKGVGKNNQGIVQPVEAVIKKDNTCLGSGQFEEKPAKTLSESMPKKEETEAEI